MIQTSIRFFISIWAPQLPTASSCLAQHPFQLPPKELPAVALVRYFHAVLFSSRLLGLRQGAGSLQLFAFLVFISLTQFSFAQSETTYARPDSTQLLPLAEYITWVKSNHPIARQADLIREEGNARRLRAKGGFDPVAYYINNGKQFDDKQYYRYEEGGVAFNTWPGIKFQGSFSRTGGEFINPDRTMPQSGLLAVGADLPILQGLITDDRRAALTQANLFRQYSRFMQQRMLNDLLLSAIRDYWDWTLAYASYQLREDFVKVARERLRLVNAGYRAGNFPAVDTLEAYILVQSRELSLEDARVKLNEARLKLSNNLWSDDLEPLELDREVYPLVSPKAVEFPIGFDSLVTITQELADINPELNLLDYRVRDIKVEERLAKNNLLPRLNLKYNFLTEEVGLPDAAGLSFNPNNYNYGVEFQLPLFLRRERAQLKLTQLRLREAEFQRDLRGIAIRRQLEQEAYELENLVQRLVLAENNFKKFQELLRVEQRRFQIGQSSLFLVNAREVQAIDAELLYLSLLNSYRINVAEFFRAAGILVDYSE